MNHIINLLNRKEKIAVVGLGYVGLPMAVLFAKKYDVIGFDVKEERVKELKNGIDKTGEVDNERLKKANIFFTTEPEELKNARVIIVTVPTPIDKYNAPDLNPLISASTAIGRSFSKGSFVVYESTVYPGLTEEECVPILERESGFKWKKDFNVGYSPERINPGDKEHSVDKIKKVVSGDTKETTDFLAELYQSVLEKEVYRASDIKTAEAAKIIENTQRDINIAFINELSMMFAKMGIDTKEVLEAASTKWNFLRFEPGLVGGHCIGVDPYYLTFKAESIGYHPQVILSGRRINDSMGKYVAENTVKMLIRADKTVKGSKILILGLTFKENIPDIRNTRVVDIYNELNDFGVDVDIYDPVADKKEVKKEYGITLVNRIGNDYDAAILAVKHKKIVDEFTLDKCLKVITKKPVLIDVKGIYNKNEALKKGFVYWRL